MCVVGGEMGVWGQAIHCFHAVLSQTLLLCSLCQSGQEKATKISNWQFIRRTHLHTGTAVGTWTVAALWMRHVLKGHRRTKGWPCAASCRCKRPEGRRETGRWVNETSEEERKGGRRESSSCSYLPSLPPSHRGLIKRFPGYNSFTLQSPIRHAMPPMFSVGSHFLVAQWILTHKRRGGTTQNVLWPTTGSYLFFIYVKIILFYALLPT